MKKIKKLLFYLKRKDQRKFIRLPLHHLLKYKIIEKEDKISSISFVKNISAAGILFYSKEYIPLGSILELEILIPAYGQTLKVNSSVVRVDFLRKTGGFDIGIKFINPDEKIVEFINNRIVDAYKKVKKKEKKKMRILASIFIILAVIAAIFGFISRFIGLHLPIAPSNWISVVNMILLFSIAISALVIARK